MNIFTTIALVVKQRYKLNNIYVGPININIYLQYNIDL